MRPGGRIHQMRVMPHIKVRRIKKIDLHINLSMSSGERTGMRDRKIHRQGW